MGEKRSEPIPLRAADGVALEGEYFAPAGAPRAVVVIASATAVPRRLYVPFCEHLRDSGMAAFTFDYRGVGGSRPAKLRGFRASMHDWGEQDLEAAIAWAVARHPGVPLFLVGHSVGGQITGLAQSSKLARGILFVAAQSGWWRLWPSPYRWRMAFNWYVLIPLVVPLLGYAPMSRMGAGEDIPGGVAREWASWCRDREYIRGYFRGRPNVYETISAPLRAYAFTDDPYAPKAAIEHLLTFYSAASRDLKVVSPAEAGHPIGHFGFFRDRFRDTLWREAIEWFASVAEVSPARGAVAPTR